MDEAMNRDGDEPLIPKQGGYRKLKSFQLAELVSDITVLFCDKYIDYRSRTRDQMVQAARSGVQNIVEGSQVSGTSKKMEMKLTNVARASLEELRRDFLDFLRQRDLPQWGPDHPTLKRFKARRCSSMHEFRSWVADEVKRETFGHDENGIEGENTDGHGLTRTETIGSAEQDQEPSASHSVRVRPCSSVFPSSSSSSSSSSPPSSSSPSVSPSVFPSVVAANGALSLLNLCCYLLDRQLAAQAAAFREEGGFTERLYRERSRRR